MRKTNNFQLSASIICSNFFDIKNDLKELEKGSIDCIHFDVMDGIFVPRFGLFPELLSTIKELTQIPVNVHMMTVNPEPFIDVFVKAGADAIVIHAEIQSNILQVLQQIKKKGIKAGIAFNPATSLDSVKYIKDYLDIVTLMAINPGILNQKLIPSVYPKIIELRDIINAKSIIEIDGGVTPETAPQLIKTGASMLVCGTGTIFQPPNSITKKIQDLKKKINYETRA